MAISRRARAELENASKKVKTEAATSIQVGDALPDVEVTLQNEETVNLAKQYGSQVLALFAYPKASTPGCTRQTSGFGKLREEFEKLGVAVFGISADSPKAQTTFKNKTEVDFDLISDPSYKLLGPLGAKKSPKGVIRSHWLFVNGKAVLVEHSVKPDDSPKTILEAAKEHIGEASQADQPNEEANGPEQTTNEELTADEDAKAKEEDAPEQSTKEALAEQPNDQPQDQSSEEPNKEETPDEKSSNEQPETGSQDDADSEGSEESKKESSADTAAEGPSETGSTNTAVEPEESATEAPKNADTTIAKAEDPAEDAKAESEGLESKDETAETKA